jgi:hypothetical protein
MVAADYGPDATTTTNNNNNTATLCHAGSALQRTVHNTADYRALYSSINTVINTDSRLVTHGGGTWQWDVLPMSMM